MKNDKKRFLETSFIVVLLLTTIMGEVALTQEKFPTRPITLIVPWAAGGGMDLTSRAVQPTVEKVLGQSLVIVNKTGGGGAIGLSEIANSTPDGYTIGITSPALPIMQYTVKANIDYRKYEPVIFGGYSPMGIIVRVDAPWNTLKEFLDYCKANPGKVRVGHSGYGASFHIGAIAMEDAASVKFTLVPYKGAAPSSTALLGGHIDAAISGIGDILPLVKGRKIKFLGIADLERSPFVPDAQTFKELGMELELSTYYFWIGPKGIPKERVKILHDAFKKAIESKEFREFCEKQGVTILHRGTEESVKFLEEEDKKWKRLIMIGGIKPE